MICANINHPEYIALERATSEIVAHKVWDKLNGEVSNLIGETDSQTAAKVKALFENNDSLSSTKEDLKKLNTRLVEILTPFGVTVEVLDNLKERTGTDAVGAADTLNKVIMVTKGQAGQEVLPEEASHFFIDLLGDNNPLVQRMIELAPATELYNKEYKTYYDLYNGNEAMIAKEVAGKLLGDYLIRKYKEENSPRLYRTLDLIWNKIKSIFSRIPSNTINDQIEAVYGKTAEQILNGSLSAFNVENLSGEVYFNAGGEKVTIEDVKEASIEQMYEKALKNINKKITSLEKQLNKTKSNLSKLKVIGSLKSIKTALEQNKKTPIQGLQTYAGRAAKDILYLKKEILRLESEGEVTAEDLKRLHHQAEAYQDIRDMVVIFESELAPEDLEEGMPGRELIDLVTEARSNLDDFNTKYNQLGRVVLSNFLIEFSSKAKLHEGHEFKLTAKDIAEELAKVESDPSILAAWVDAMANSKDNVLALVSKVIHIKKEEARLEAEDIIYGKDGLIDKLEALEKYQKSRGIPLENKKKLYDFMLLKNSKGELTGRVVDINSKQGQELKNLPEGNPLREFYMFFLNTYADAQEKLPYSKRPKGLELPSILANDMDILLQGESVLKAAKENIKDKFSFRADETEYNRANDQQFVPVRFHAPIGTKEGEINPNDLSYNLGESLARFTTMAINNEKMREIINEMELAKDLVGAREVVKKGVPKIGTGSNAYRQLKEFLDANLYGELKLTETWEVAGQEINVGKVADTINSYTSLRSLAINLFSGISNVTYGQAMTMMEAHGGQFFNKKDLIFANLEYDKSITGFMKDVNQKKPTSKIGLLNMKYDTLQEFDEYGNPIKDSTLGRRIFKKGSLFFLQTSGEHMMQSTLMVAMMKNKKFKLKNGVEISLYDAYTVEDGHLKLHPEVAEQYSTQDLIDFSQKMNAVSQKLHGIYSNIDSAIFQRRAVGRMAVMFRKWLVPGIRRRYQSKQYDERTESIEEGYYMTTLDFITGFKGDLKNFKFKLMQTKFKDLEPWQQANLRRAAMEISYIVGSLALIAIIRGLSDDDEKKRGWMANMMLYQLYRFNSEAMFYVHPGETMKILKSPAASITAAENIMTFAYRGMADAALVLTGQEPARYKRDSGIYKKGDLRLLKNFEDLVPIWKEVRALQMPENRLSWMKWK